MYHSREESDGSTAKTLLSIAKLAAVAAGSESVPTLTVHQGRVTAQSGVAIARGPGIWDDKQPVFALSQGDCGGYTAGQSWDALTAVFQESSHGLSRLQAQDNLVSLRPK